jgi:ABC-type multidrug transport system fused ATPase/permease subunit
MSHTYGQVMGMKRIFIVITALVLFVIFLAIYEKNVSVEFGIATSIVTFVYGFFLSSVFGFIQRKFIDFSTNMADLSANIQSFYDMMRLSNQPKLKEKTKKTLLEFITSLKTLSPRKYEQNQDHIDKLFALLKDFKIKNKKDSNIFGRMLSNVNSIAINRERAEFFGDRFFIGEMRFIFLLLTALVSLMIILLCIRTWYLIIFGLILVLTLIFVSSLLFNMDRMRYGKRKIRGKNLEELMECIRRG